MYIGNTKGAKRDNKHRASAASGRAVQQKEGIYKEIQRFTLVRRYSPGSLLQRVFALVEQPLRLDHVCRRVAAWCALEGADDFTGGVLFLGRLSSSSLLMTVALRFFAADPFVAGRVSSSASMRSPFNAKNVLRRRLRTNFYNVLLAFASLKILR